MIRRLFAVAMMLSIVCCLLRAQEVDSAVFIMPKRQSLEWLIAPSVLIVSGIALNGNGAESIKNEIVEWRNEHLSMFHTHADDYLQYAPIVIAYGLDAFGNQSKNDFINKSLILLKGELLMTGLVYGLKNATHELRPDLSAYNSFPSGHTAQAFAGAVFLSEEYKDKIKWMPYLAYGIASSVGLLRMANNRHYISDVLAGAGIGMLSMKLAYVTHKYRWGKKN
jgi:membrane-associated phospholipid phosphatase